VSFVVGNWRRLLGPTGFGIERALNPMAASLDLTMHSAMGYC
jgi:hypothetical protein